jgi:hypothetical protein
MLPMACGMSLKLRIPAIAFLLILVALSGTVQADTNESNTAPTCGPRQGAEPPQCALERRAATGCESSRVKPKCPCPLRDEGEGEGEGEPEAADAPERGSSVGRYLRQVIPIVVAVLVIAFAAPLPRAALRRRLPTILLTICAMASIGTYIDWGQWRNDRYVNGWEFFHYYLGSKYLPELGHTGLYEAALVADVETGRQFSHKKNAIRNLTTGGCIRVDEVLSRTGAIKARFGSARWAEFKQDIRYFKNTLSPWQWNGVFHDKGYNATPVWSMFVGRLTNWIDTSQPVGLLNLALLDPVLILLSIVAVGRSFGPRAALLMIVLIGTHMIMSHSHMKGALLRTDWVMALVLAICCLKSDRPVLAGALAAYAASVRVFPAFFALPLLAQPIISWARREPRHPSQMRFLTGFCVALALLVTTSIFVVGWGHCQEFVAKIWQHNNSFSPWRVGFKHLFLGAYEYQPENAATLQQVFQGRWVSWWMIQAIVLAGCAFLARRLENWEILALGFVPTFFLVAPTYYYYMMLVVPLLFFAGRPRRPESALGIVMLLLSSNVGYFIYERMGRELQLFYALSLMILVVGLLMCFSALLRATGWRISLSREYAQPIPARPTPSR